MYNKTGKEKDQKTKHRKEKETRTYTHQFLCPPCLNSGSINRFVSCPFLVSADEVKKKANIIAVNLVENE